MGQSARRSSYSLKARWIEYRKVRFSRRHRLAGRRVSDVLLRAALSRLISGTDAVRYVPIRRRLRHQPRPPIRPRPASSATGCAPRPRSSAASGSSGWLAGWGEGRDERGTDQTPLLQRIPMRSNPAAPDMQRCLEQRGVSGKNRIQLALC
jgi:hypothetical protein